MWDHDRHWYTIGAVALAGAMTGLRLGGVEPNSTAAIGPVFDFDAGQLASGESPESISSPMEQNSVNELQLALFIGGSGLGVLSLAASDPCGDPVRCHARNRRLLDLTMGYIETMALTFAITEATKLGFGRLRPDFLDRYERFDCDNAPSSPNCLAARKSFVSGHSSMAAAAATYTVLVIGGRYVWGKTARDEGDWRTLTIGILAQAGVLSMAGYIGTSRVADNRHHQSDVWAGLAVGAALANLSYWTYFDTDGNPRGLDLQPGVSADSHGARFTLSGRF